MKKFLCLCMVVAMAMVMGCAKKKPEDVAKAYVTKQINLGSPVNANTANLEYEVLQQDEETAMVKVTGTIELDGNILLLKENNKWIIAEEKPATAPHAAPAGVH